MKLIDDLIRKLPQRPQRYIVIDESGGSVIFGGNDLRIAKNFLMHVSSAYRVRRFVLIERSVTGKLSVIGYAEGGKMHIQG